MSANPTHDAVVAHNDIEKLEKGDNHVSDMHRRTSPTATSFDEKHATEVAHDDAEVAQHQEAKSTFYARYRPFILAATALVILGWWVSATVLKTTRHRWIVQSLFAWSFIFIIAFRFLPTSIISRPIEAVWEPTISRPFFKLPYKTRLGLGWLALLGAVFGSAYGFPLENGSTYVDRTICVVGLLLFQLGFFASSRNRSAIPWPTVIVGLFFQQVIAMFVLKTTAGFDIFTWIATLASDFLNQGQLGVAFFFSQDIADSHWFFASTLGAIMFFIAFIQMLYYLGVMQWLIKNFAWFFFKTMGVSGAEAVVAAASPWVGQGESACLIKPYVDVMTESEIHLVMTSGFSCIAGSVLAVYIGLGAGAQNLVTSSVMSIPASIAISKMRLPEMDTPVTLGRVVVDRGKEDEKNRPANAIHAFSKGAIFGLIIAGQILANVFTILALIGAINGLLTWIGRGFGIHQLTIELVLGYVFYPLTFFMGVPRHEILRVSKLIATKLVANEFVAYTTLKEITASENPLTYRAHTIAAYALCGFANLGSLGIQIGVLTAMAPSRGKIIASIAGSAMICGFLSTMQTAAIAGMLL